MTKARTIQLDRCTGMPVEVLAWVYPDDAREHAQEIERTDRASKVIVSVASAPAFGYGPPVEDR